MKKHSEGDLMGLVLCEVVRGRSQTRRRKLLQIEALLEDGHRQGHRVCVWIIYEVKPAELPGNSSSDSSSGGPGAPRLRRGADMLIMTLVGCAEVRVRMHEVEREG